MRFMLNNLSMI